MAGPDGRPSIGPVLAAAADHTLRRSSA